MYQRVQLLVSQINKIKNKGVNIDVQNILLNSWGNNYFFTMISAHGYSDSLRVDIQVQSVYLWLIR